MTEVGPEHLVLSAAVEESGFKGLEAPDETTAEDLLASVQRCLLVAESCKEGMSSEKKENNQIRRRKHKKTGEKTKKTRENRQMEC